VTTGEVKRGRGRPRELEGRHDFTISVDVETMDAIEQLAEAKQLTLSAVVRLLIRQALRERAAVRRRTEAKRSSGVGAVGAAGR
jgi:hypothetical protein